MGVKINITIGAARKSATETRYPIFNAGHQVGDILREEGRRGYAVMINNGNPHITGGADPLSLRVVQWQEVAYSGISRLDRAKQLARQEARQYVERQAAA